MLSSKRSLDQRADPTEQGQNEGICPIRLNTKNSYAEISDEINQF